MINVDTLQHNMDVLKHLVAREHSLGTAIHGVYKTRTESEIGPSLRDKVMMWIWILNQNFNFLPETFALTVHIFDIFLLKMKVKVRYLRCVAITAYFLSIKTVEEEENIPSINELLQASECGCPKPDILKMEKIILNALKWKIHIATPITFLHHFYLLFDTHITDLQNTSEDILTEAEEKIQECMCKWQLTQFKTSVLGVAVLESILKKYLNPSSLLQAQKIQQIAQIDHSELVQCKLMIERDGENDDFLESNSKGNEKTLLPSIKEETSEEADQTKACLLIWNDPNNNESKLQLTSI